MIYKFAAAASSFTAAVGHAQGGQILDTFSKDFQKVLHSDYLYLDDKGMEDEDMIGWCVYGDTKVPTIESFEGEFEGLLPRPGQIKLKMYAHGKLNL